MMILNMKLETLSIIYVKNFGFQRVETLLKVLLINALYVANLKDLVMIIQNLDRYLILELISIFYNRLLVLIVQVQSMLQTFIIPKIMIYIKRGLF